MVHGDLLVDVSHANGEFSMGLEEFYRPKKGLCPYTGFKKVCNPDCELFIEVPKMFEAGGTVIFKGCVHRLTYLETMNQTQRLAMMQAEVGETKNATIVQTAAICQLIGDESNAENIRKIPGPDNKEF